MNTYTTRTQEDPSVAVDADGDFVVMWMSDGSQYDEDDGNIQGQRFITSRIFRDGFESADVSAWSSSVP